MKKKIAVIVSAVHLALWVALMVLCAAAWIVYDGSGEGYIRRSVCCRGTRRYFFRVVAFGDAVDPVRAEYRA